MAWCEAWRRARCAEGETAQEERGKGRAQRARLLKLRELEVQLMVAEQAATVIGVRVHMRRAFITMMRPLIGHQHRIIHHYGHNIFQPKPDKLGAIRR